MNALRAIAGAKSGAAWKANEVEQHFGCVATIRESGEYVVRYDATIVTAKRASSCLLEPAEGDRVLVASDGREAFVLAVLSRASEGRATLSVEGDVTLRSTNGSVSIAAKENVDIASAREVTLTAPSLAIRALEATMFSESFAMIGRAVRAEIDRAKIVGNAVDSVLERVSQRVKRSFRAVEDVDHVRAGQIDYNARGNAMVRGDNAVIAADKLVKINGEQVHLG